MKFLWLILFCLGAMPAFAQTDSFTVRLFLDVDSVPPTTPEFVSATPVAFTQIDLAWSSSTDNSFLSGYVLFRDGQPIATTTQTTFSDTGLLSSTTYAYVVQAFDSAFNYSSSSATATVTTLTPPVSPPPPAAPLTSTHVRPRLVGFDLEPGLQDVRIRAETSRPTRYEIRWGRTGSYELGYIERDAYADSFTTTLTGLQPGTTYQYQVVGITPLDRRVVLREGSFQTETVYGALPTNVWNLTATPSGNDVALEWRLPPVGVEYVRIVRSPLGYPSSPADGAIVYQGAVESFRDPGVLNQFSPVYYTVFSYNEVGMVSSGAVTAAAVTVDGESIVLPATALNRDPISTEGDISVFDGAATTTNTTDPALVRIPNRAEIQIITETVQFTFASPQIEIAKDAVYTVVVPTEAVSTNLKTLLLNLTDPTDSRKEYSYILRLNPDGTAYEATINAFLVSGSSEFTFMVYDYEAKIVATYQKRVRFTGGDRANATVFFPDYFLERPLIAVGFIASIGLILLLLFIAVAQRRVAT